MRNRFLISAIAVVWGVMASRAAFALPAKEPLFLTAGISPMVMFALSVDHQLFIKAFGDFSDLDGDGVLDNQYVDSFDYYGYFDSARCYQYDSGTGYFRPRDAADGANGHHCNNAASSGDWSGNFLNWATMTRIDVIRKALYGGKRSTDTNAQTVLERALLANDVHAFAKVFSVASSDMVKYTPYTETTITMCNSTPPPTSGSDETQNMDTAANPPKMRIVSGDWGRWAGGERNQCEYYQDAQQANRDAGIVPAYADNLFASGTRNAPNVKVETCVANKLEDNCRTYDPTTAAKPIGLLQEHGEDKTLRFGLMSGSYDKRDKGGVLRKAMSYFAGNTTASDDEVNLLDGTFNTSVNGIISTLNRIRLNTWDYGDTHYNDCDTFGINVNTYLTSGSANRKCSNWGNPMSELYLEAVRYLIGEGSATGTFNVASDALGLPTATWDDPMPADDWCTPMNIVMLSSGDNSFDTDHLGTVPSVLGNINSATDAIGVAEGFSGNVYIGEVGATPLANPDTNICSAKTFTNLSHMRGLCPTSPNKQGGYAMAGLAHKANTVDLRSDRDNDPLTSEGQTISTYAIAMAKNLPDFVVPLGSGALNLVPIAYAGPTSSTPAVDSSDWASSSLAQLSIEDQVYSGGDLTYVRFLAMWEDSAWGNDYDMDMVSRISICVASECANHDDDGDGSNDSNPGANTARVTVRFMHAEGGVSMKIGFVAVGTSADGEYAEIRKFHGGGANFSSFDDDPGRDVEEPTPQSYTFTAGSSVASLLPTPLELAAKYGGFRDSDGDNMPNQAVEWDQDSDGVADSFFFADDPSQIGPKLASFLSVIATTSSAASVVANSVSLQTTTRIYQASFDSTDWSGSVFSFPVDVQTGALLTAEWNAADLINGQDWDTGREWLTWDSTTGAGIPFRWADLNAAQQLALNINPVSGSPDTLGSDRLDYLRGDSTNEQANGSGTFRDRASVLGDVVHSTPTVVGAPNFGYRDSIEPSAPYSAFKAQYADVACVDDQGNPRAVGLLDREPILYFGANDGALHGVSACTGVERIAYVPSAAYPDLSKLTAPDYSHHYYVDGASTVVDAFFSNDSSWHTVLVGTLAAGGKGIFALDVTNPANFSESSASQVVLWDKTPADTGYGELGYTFSQPAVVKAQGHGWVAVFGNGYHGTSGKAVLYIARIYDGTLLQTIDLSASGPGSVSHGSGNGLSTIAPIDSDGDGDVDLIYGGDLNGNVWRFEANGSGFSRANTTLLYKAKNATGTDDQPITSRMSVGLHPTSAVGRMVYFGTGKYYEQLDNDPLNAVQYNSMYGIWDRDTGATISSVVARNSNILQQQTIDTQTLGTFDGNPFEVRVLSNTPMKWALPGDACAANSSCGWYLDLTDGGEKMVSNPTLRGGRLIFVTTVPSALSCDEGGTGWLMEIDPATGGRLDVPVFDLSGDGVFNANDNLSQSDIVSGIKSKVGIIQPPAILAGIGGKGDGSFGGVEGKYSSGSRNAQIEVTIENPGLLGAGRKSWVRTQ